MRYVIIGASAAGVSCAENLRKHAPAAEITLISDETFALYSRCLLTYLIAGTIGEKDLAFKAKNFFEANKIITHLGKKALSVDRQKKVVLIEGNQEVVYHKLLLATGASAKTVKAPGVEKKGVFTVRKIDDARAILAMMERVEDVVVLGGGLIGLRDAYAFSLRKKRVTVVVKSPQILSQMIDQDAAKIISYILEENGIKILTGTDAKEITGGESVEGVVLDNGQKLSCQMVIIGKGVKANSQLAEQAGLKVEEGILTDEFLRTSDSNIFAAGDCAQTFDLARQKTRVNALWPCAVEQGEKAALNMMGKQTSYAGSLSMNSVDFFGLPCISLGITRAKDRQEYKELIKKENGKYYKKLVLKENKIVGMVLVNDIRIAGIIARLIQERIDVTPIRHLLLDDNFDYAKILPLIKANQDKFKQEEFQDTMMSY